jgi:hypothetical protein
MRKVLGKIEKAFFGMGGYQDAMIGIGFNLSGDGGMVHDFWGDWATKHSEGCQWTHAERITRLGEVSWRIRELLSDARVDTVERLAGKPIEITYDGMMLKSWRVLTEVL